MTSTVVADSGRRERKKQATRQAIHEAAVDLVGERGLAAVTVEAIAERADVATRTFFNHFRSKEEAVLGRGPVDVDEVAVALAGELAGGAAPLDALEVALGDAVVARSATPEDLRRRMALVRAEPTLLAASSAHWEEAAASLTHLLAEATGEDPSGYPSLVLAVAVAAVRCACLRWAGRPGADLGSELADAFAAVRAGLPAGRPHPSAPDPARSDR